MGERFVWSKGRGEFVSRKTGAPMVDRSEPWAPVMPAVVGDYEPYHCVVTGQVIDGRRARREMMDREGVREVDPSENPIRGFTDPKKWGQPESTQREHQVKKRQREMPEGLRAVNEATGEMFE